MTEKAVLYLGVDPKHFKTEKPLIHCPLVEIVARPIDSMEIKQIFGSLFNYTHIIFTTKSAVRIFFEYFQLFGYSKDQLRDRYIIAVGAMVASFIKEEGVNPTYIASDESMEGIVRLLSSLDLNHAKVLFPKSCMAKPMLAHFLVEQEIHHQICTLYDIYHRKPFQLPDLTEVDEVIFPDPNTVDVFFSLFEEVPADVKLHPIGGATREALRIKLGEQSSVVGMA